MSDRCKAFNRTFHRLRTKSVVDKPIYFHSKFTSELGLYGDVPRIVP